MAFRFSLATLLRLREIAEQREERLLIQIQNQIGQCRLTLADLAVQRKNLIAQRELTMQQQMSAAEILGLYARVRTIEELERTGVEEIAKLDLLRKQQMKIYEAANRNRELLAGIRDEQREAFQRERVRQEQNLMDDNFSSRRSLR